MYINYQQLIKEMDQVNEQLRKVKGEKRKELEKRWQELKEQINQKHGIG